MREAVLETRVDAGGRALVMFRGAPLQGCSGLEMSAAVTAIAAWARANNGIVRMHTVLPDGSATEDFIHGDGTVVPVVRAAPGRRTARPEPVMHPAPVQRPPAYAQAPAAPAYQAPPQPRPAPVRPDRAYAAAPASPGHAQPAAPVRHDRGYAPAPANPAVPEAPVRHDRGYAPATPAAPAVPEPVATFPADPFVRMNRAREDPPRAPHRMTEAVQIAAGVITPPPHSQASWRAPLDGDEEIIDIESPAAAGSPPLSPLRRNLLRAAVVILLAAAAVLLGFMFLTPGPGAPVAAELQLERAAAVTDTSVPDAGAGAPMPGNPMLTLAAAGGLAAAAGGAGGLALLKFRRKRSAGKPVPDDDLGEDLAAGTEPVPEAGDISRAADTDTGDIEEPEAGTEPVPEAGDVEEPAVESGADGDDADGKHPAPLP